MQRNYLHIDGKDKLKTIYNSNYNNNTNIRLLFLSLTVSGYHINTTSKSFGRSKRPISGFRHSGRPEAPASGRNLGLKISPIESP